MNPNIVRNTLLAVALACVAAACNQDVAAAGEPPNSSAPSRATATDMVDGDVPAISDASMGSIAPFHDRSAPNLPRAAGEGIAAAPDPGDLMVYPARRVARRMGPYTWHRVDVSEAHALRAMVDGALTLTTPSGSLLRFGYDRHVEHPSGDWTWFGHVVDGDAAQDAILTFGRDAVSGRIQQPDGRPLALMMRDGASWLVETDPAQPAAAEALGRAATAAARIPGAYVVDDVDGDGDADVFWRDDAKTRFAVWLMDGATREDAIVFKVNANWDVVARGDLDGDHLADVVWTNGISLVLWKGDGSGRFTSTRVGAMPGGWRISGVADVNGDGKDDLLWRNVLDTKVGYWLMDGDRKVGQAIFGAGPTWKLSGMGDLDADGRADLVWTDGRRVVAWTSNGRRGFISRSVRAQPEDWSVYGTGDVDGDGKDDLFWKTDPDHERYADNGYQTPRHGYWLMDGSRYRDSRIWSPHPFYGTHRPMDAIGDYNGDGLADLIGRGLEDTWGDRGTRVLLSLGNGETFEPTVVRDFPRGWHILGLTGRCQDPGDCWR